MKCVKSSDGIILRIDDLTAEEKTRSDSWTYCPKSEWKAFTETNKKKTNKKKEK